ncbi:hypothetical protein Mpal_0377 [Methanosphaerula palustris E1-9c]|uniref:Uncharacterized protein n=1 Tax=Methanosphaerula palustris (strain ATCC BAA-1556 / DSM 19958 / E1-9c) TaxID=521011 RepID=B8GJV0_METPE|nr:hypothetical protein Mpal_0377 [Methanosphaerula palustris E1-9c]
MFVRAVHHSGEGVARAILWPGVGVAGEPRVIFLS